MFGSPLVKRISHAFLVNPGAALVAAADGVDTSSGLGVPLAASLSVRSIATGGSEGGCGLGQIVASRPAMAAEIYATRCDITQNNLVVTTDYESATDSVSASQERKWLNWQCGIASAISEGVPFLVYLKFAADLLEETHRNAHKPPSHH
jgi:hypothetical protein